MTKELEKKKLEMARKMHGVQRGNENKKYGEFILQTNDVQYNLIILIMLSSLNFDETLFGNLQKKTMGQLINRAQKCILFPKGTDMLSMLNEYLESRNKLAHKMYTSEHLTPKECNEALATGEKILTIFDKLIKIITKKFK